MQPKVACARRCGSCPMSSVELRFCGQACPFPLVLLQTSTINTTTSHALSDMGLGPWAIGPTQSPIPHQFSFFSPYGVRRVGVRGTSLADTAMGCLALDHP